MNEVARILPCTCRRAAPDSMLLLWLCKPAGDIGRDCDPILASSSGTLKQRALDDEPASRTCFHMALSLRTPIYFAAAEGGRRYSAPWAIVPLYGTSGLRFWFIRWGRMGSLA
ncbi:hypothetical protein TRVL_01810 [Trypanosoma vivax]|nr:hypothetical protein TRVL_01810 [Trypanosoma vivax]